MASRYKVGDGGWDSTTTVLWSSARPKQSAYVADGRRASQTKVDLSFYASRGLDPLKRPKGAFPWKETAAHRRRRSAHERQQEQRYKMPITREGVLPLRTAPVYWSKKNAFCGPTSAPVVKFKLRQLAVGQSVHLPAMKKIPKSVTPAMETILIDVARKVHDQRMDDIHARVIPVREQQMAPELRRAIEDIRREEAAAKLARRTVDASGQRMPAAPRARKPVVKSLAHAAKTKRQQAAFEAARDAKKASWQAQYARAAAAEKKLLNETRLVMTILGNNQ